MVRRRSDTHHEKAERRVRKTTCDGCGQPLGHAILEVRTVLVDMPVGTFHSVGACYTKAVVKLREGHADGNDSAGAG